jgi:hypothetical protein
MSDLQGMTINERLYALKKIDEFDAAIKARDAEGAIQILEMCEFSRSGSLATVTAIFNNPKDYGY